MTSLVYAVYAIGIYGVALSLADSSIQLSANTPTIQPLLTPQLTLTCQLNSTSADAQNAQHGGASSDCDVTSTSKEIEFISSIVISKDTGEEVAAVTEHDLPRLTHTERGGGGGTRAVVVSGNVTGGHGGGIKGHLQVTWDTPTGAESGKYICEVNSVARGGHGVSFKTSLEVPVVTPSVDDLVLAIHKLQVKQQSMEHIEQGIVECGNSSTWKDQSTFADRYGDDHKSTNKTVQFSRAYTTAPLVHIAVLDAYINKDKHQYFNVDLVEVKDEEFTVKCSMYSRNIYHFMKNLRLSWISLPQTH